MKKIIVYSHDTFGLGNIRRMLTISRNILAQNPDLSIRLITGSSMIDRFDLPKLNFDFVKLPSINRNEKGMLNTTNNGFTDQLPSPMKARVTNVIQSPLAKTHLTNDHPIKSTTKPGFFSFTSRISAHLENMVFTK